MLYLKITNEDGTISFHPLRENNIYVQCEICGSMVPVDDPINFIAEMADMGIIMDDAFFRERKSYFAIVRKMKSSLIRCPDGGGAKGGQPFHCIKMVVTMNPCPCV